MTGALITVHRFISNIIKHLDFYEYFIIKNPKFTL